MTDDTLNVSQLNIVDSKGQTRISFSVEKEGKDEVPRITIIDHKLRPRIYIRVTKKGPTLGFLNENGSTSFGLSMFHESLNGLVINDSTGKLAITMLADGNRNPQLSFYNNEGEMIFSLPS